MCVRACEKQKGLGVGMNGVLSAAGNERRREGAVQWDGGGGQGSVPGGDEGLQVSQP
jgi:hypothetical protein